MLEMDHLIHTVWLSGEFSIGFMIEMRQCIIRSVIKSNVYIYIFFYFLNLQHGAFTCNSNVTTITFNCKKDTTILSIDRSSSTSIALNARVEKLLNKSMIYAFCHLNF